MKLYEMPRNTQVRVVVPKHYENGDMQAVANDEYFFHHIDGMYSLCRDVHGDIVRLAAWTEVVPV